MLLRIELYFSASSSDLDFVPDEVIEFWNDSVLHPGSQAGFMFHPSV